MTRPEPLVTVGLPVYNGARFIAQALDSLLAQDHTAFEIVVSDNASEDGTRDIVDSYQRSDPRIRYERQPTNRGAAWNFNRTVELARGTFFMWAAADDERAPTCVSACLEALEAEPEAVLAYPAAVDIDEDGAVIPQSYPADFRTDAPEPHLRFRDLVAVDHECFQIFGLARTELLRETRLILPQADSDRILLAELALRGPLAAVDEVLFFRRQHPDRSMVAYPTARLRAGWFDPAKARQVTWPAWRQGFELARAVRLAPLPPAERIRCYVAMWHWLRLAWPRLVKNIGRGGIEHTRNLTHRLRKVQPPSTRR